MEKQFAVGYFPDENIHSELPVSWLTPKKTQCWWPKGSINVSHVMSRNDRPDPNKWTLCNVEIDSYCSTLEAARKRAEDPDFASNSEESRGKGHRKKFPISKESSSEDETITPPPSPKSEPKAKKKNPKKKSSDRLSKEKESAAIQNENVIFDIETLQIESLPIVIEGPGTSITEHCPSTTVHCASRTTKDITLEDVLNVCQDTRKCVREILKVLIKLQNIKNTDISQIKKQLPFPLKSLDQLMDFNKKLGDDEELQSSFILQMRSTGGRDFKDHLRTCLRAMFSNELAVACSLEGRREKFKLKGLPIIDFLLNMLLRLYEGCTSSQIQQEITEWFRLSHQRLKKCQSVRND